MQYGHWTQRTSGSEGARAGNTPLAMDLAIRPTVCANVCSTTSVSGTSTRLPRSLRTNQYIASTGVSASPKRARAACA